MEMILQNFGAHHLHHLHDDCLKTDLTGYGYGYDYGYGYGGCYSRKPKMDYLVFVRVAVAVAVAVAGVCLVLPKMDFDVSAWGRTYVFMRGIILI